MSFAAPLTLLVLFRENRKLFYGLIDQRHWSVHICGTLICTRFCKHQTDVLHWLWKSKRDTLFLTTSLYILYIYIMCIRKAYLMKFKGFKTKSELVLYACECFVLLFALWISILKRWNVLVQLPLPSRKYLWSFLLVDWICFPLPCLRGSQVSFVNSVRILPFGFSPHWMLSL